MSQEAEALELLRKAGVKLEGKRIGMAPGVYQKKVWRAVDYLMFECEYGFKEAEPMTG